MNEATKNVEIARLTALVAVYQRRHNDVSAIVERVNRLCSGMDVETKKLVKMIVADWREYDTMYGE